MFIAILILAIPPEVRFVQRLHYSATLNRSFEMVYSFVPCRGDSSPGLYIEIWFSATKPVTLIVVDEEQYHELFSRSDLYGYLAYIPNASRSRLGFYYAKSIPCWPIYVLAKGVQGTRIELDIVIKSR